MTSGPGGAVPPAAGRRPSTGATYLWALAPLITLGLATWAVFLYAAIRRRSWWLGGASAAYLALLVVFLATGNGNAASVREGISAASWLVIMVGGCAQALAVRGWVFGTEPPAADRLRAAEREALRHRKLREQAREVVARDPALARELGIGRPDLRRDYDDGGLVDVNHAPAAVLATLPGMTAELAARAVELRESRGAFVSADDLSLALDMPTDWVTALADMTVYPG